MLPTRNMTAQPCSPRIPTVCSAPIPLDADTARHKQINDFFSCFFEFCDLGVGRQHCLVEFGVDTVDAVDG